jgi:hypothetical protein
MQMKKVMLALAAVVCLSAPALAQYGGGGYGGYNSGYSRDNDGYNSYTRGGYGGYRDRSYDRGYDRYRRDSYNSYSVRRSYRDSYSRY